MHAVDPLSQDAQHLPDSNESSVCSSHDSDPSSCVSSEMEVEFNLKRKSDLVEEEDVVIDVACLHKDSELRKKRSISGRHTGLPHVAADHPFASSS